MNKFKIISLSAEQAEKIRITGTDDFGLPVTEQIATGYGPCRVSLLPFRLGEDVRLLFKHNPFEVENTFAQPGPVFIHKKEVAPYADVHRFPAEIKADKVNFPLSLIGYSDDQDMVFTKLVGDADVDEQIGEIFDRHPEVSYLHARHSEASCYICRIERC